MDRLQGTVLNIFEIARAAISSARLSARRVFELPNKGGTFALLDDVAAVSNHAGLTNLSWTASGHTGTASTLAAFDSGGAAVLLVASSLSGSSNLVSAATSVAEDTTKIVASYLKVQHDLSISGNLMVTG